MITSIGLDHEKFLGNTRDAIGAGKLVLRSGQRVVLGADMPESVLARCRELKLQPLVLVLILWLMKRSRSMGLLGDERQANLPQETWLQAILR